MDKSFLQMSALLNAVWPAVSAIDWSHFCDQRVSAYDDTGIPKYTGLLMHRSGGGCVGATTVATGFLPRPEKSAMIVAQKTCLLETHPTINSSMEARQPHKNHWGGGVRSSIEHDVGYAITGLPEIGDHLLVSRMMLECELLSKEAWQDVTNSKTDHMTAARARKSAAAGRYTKVTSRKAIPRRNPDPLR